MAKCLMCGNFQKGLKSFISNANIIINVAFRSPPTQFAGPDTKFQMVAKPKNKSSMAIVWTDQIFHASYRIFILIHTSCTLPAPHPHSPCEYEYGLASDAVSVIDELASPNANFAK